MDLSTKVKKQINKVYGWAGFSFAELIIGAVKDFFTHCDLIQNKVIRLKTIYNGSVY